jgi:hypothetical protein
VNKLQSLADRPEELKKPNVRMFVYELEKQKEEKGEEFYTIDFAIECVESVHEFYKEQWNTRASESELAKLRGLLGRAKEFLKHANEHYDCFDYKQEDYDQWLKDLSEVCGE